MRVCLIVPASSDLDVPAELQNVANTFSEAGSVVRITDASRRGLRETLYGGTFDLVWVAGHSSAEGFKLSDGVLTPAELGRWLVAVEAWSLVLNSCFSAEHVVLIQQVVDVDVVATIAPAGVSDDAAAETALYLARALVESHDLARATRLASANGQLQYRFFPSSGRDMASMTRSEDRAYEDLAALVQVFKGDPRTGQPGLVATLNLLATRVDAMTASFDAYRSSTEARLDALERSQRAAKQVSISPRLLSLLMMVSLMLVILMFAVIIRLGGV
jgi:hypothetical protein